MSIGIFDVFTTATRCSTSVVPWLGASQLICSPNYQRLRAKVFTYLLEDSILMLT